MPYVLSIGELIDRLTIVNLKIWHTEENISEENKKHPGLLEKSESDLTEQEQKVVKKIKEMCDCVIQMNAQRVKLVESIDEFFSN